MKINDLLKTRKRMLAMGVVAIALVSLLIVFFLNCENGIGISASTEGGENGETTVSYVDMQQTITAAGQVTAAESESIYFSTAKAFKAMCVEENEVVSMGQHLILYSDGSYTNAPADGVIVGISAPTSGNYASSSNYVSLAYTDTLALSITVPESEINYVKKGDAASVTINSDTNKSYEGKITGKRAISTTLLSEKSSDSSSSSSSSDSSSSRASGDSAGFGSGGGSNTSSPFGQDSSTAYYTVELEFENDGSVMLGMSAICTIVISDRKDVMAVPITAVKYNEDDEPYVTVTDGDKTEDIVVELGDSDANYVEIVKGLTGDETIEI